MDWRSFWAGLTAGLGLHGFRLTAEEADAPAAMTNRESERAYSRWDFLTGLAVGMQWTRGTDI